MKYKIRDKVIIGKENHSYVWVDDMNEFEGTVMTIKSEEQDNSYYFTEEGYFIGDEDIEGLA